MISRGALTRPRNGLGYELMQAGKCEVIHVPKNFQRWPEPDELTHLPVNLLKPHAAQEMKAEKLGSEFGTCGTARRN